MPNTTVSPADVGPKRPSAPSLPPSSQRSTTCSRTAHNSRISVPIISIAARRKSGPNASSTNSQSLASTPSSRPSPKLLEIAANVAAKRILDDQARSPPRAVPVARPGVGGAFRASQFLRRPSQALLTLRPIGSLGRLKRPLSRGSSPSGYPAEPLVSYQTNRQVSGWIPPPQVIRAFGAHCQELTLTLLANYLGGDGMIKEWWSTMSQ